MILSLRKRLLAELAVLALLTVLFLVLFPERPTYVDVLLAILALALIASNVRFTKEIVWGQFPAEADRRTRARKSFFQVAVVSAPVVLAFLVTGAVLGYSEDGWSGVRERLGNWHLVVAFAIYLPWALLQQFLFQFYSSGGSSTFSPTRSPWS